MIEVLGIAVLGVVFYLVFDTVTTKEEQERDGIAKYRQDDENEP
jgi:hypothetical protein